MIQLLFFYSYSVKTQEEIDEGFVPPNRVVFGKRRLSSERSGEIRAFSQIVPNSRYDPSSEYHEYDLVLLLLDQPVDVTNPNGFVRPMCLAYNTNEGDEYENCAAAGWGDVVADGKRESCLCLIFEL